MEGHSICPLPEKKQSLSHIEKRCVEEQKQHFDKRVTARVFGPKAR